MTEATHHELNSAAGLMAEVRKDKRAFALLTSKLFAAGRDRYVTFGDILAEFGDPRCWPECANAK